MIPTCQLYTDVTERQLKAVMIDGNFVLEKTSIR